MLVRARPPSLPRVSIMSTAPSLDDLKRAAAARALTFVTAGMRLGLGTGSTARHFVELLAERVRDGLAVDRRADLGSDPRAMPNALRHSADDA